MYRFYSVIVNHRKLIITLYVIAALVCVVLFTQVGVDYDINDYLPKDSNSTIAIDLMKEEFGGGIPNARVMIRDISIPEALEYKEKLLAVDEILGKEIALESFMSEENDKIDSVQFVIKTPEIKAPEPEAPEAELNFCFFGIKISLLGETVIFFTVLSKGSISKNARGLFHFRKKGAALRRRP